MGRVSYRPKKGNQKAEDKRKSKQKDLVEESVVAKAFMSDDFISEEAPIISEEDGHKRLTVVSNQSNQRGSEPIQSTKVVGDLGDDYHVYIEDYVYTYLYQLAAADFTKESSAVLVGQIYDDTKEILIKGIMPINMDKLGPDAEWIDIDTANELEETRKSYFKDQQIIGWMHMQPGYGTMLTMKELREHQNIFEGDGTVCLLVDAINKIETVFVYEGDELKEQTGYCMYYERNEEMQQYMLDHPFNAVAKEEMKDNVVNQFREIGKIRKAEYMQRKNLNLTVMAASIILIALTAVIVKMNDNKRIGVNETQLAMSNQVQQGEALLPGAGTEALVPDGNEPLASDNLVPIGEEEQVAMSDEKTNNEEGVTDKSATEAAEKQEVADANKVDEQQADAKQAQAVEPAKEKENSEQVAKAASKENTNQNTEQSASKEDTEYGKYVVQQGDTLADICYKEYGDAKRSLEVAKLNGLTSTNQIYVGQELKMPK